MKQIRTYLRCRLNTGFSLSWHFFFFTHLHNMWNALWFLFMHSIMPSYWHIFHSFSTLMKLLGAAVWPCGTVPASFQALFLFSSDTASSVNLQWTEQGDAECRLPQLAHGIYSPGVWRSNGLRKSLQICWQRETAQLCFCDLVILKFRGTTLVKLTRAQS